MIKTFWKAWIFDLDDTLLDTSGKLIPKASKDVCDFLFENGLTPSIEECMNQWNLSRSKKNDDDFFRSLCHSNPNISNEKMISLSKMAQQIFRTPLLPEKLELMEGGLEILEKASELFPIYLVTQGDIPTQINKVKKLGILHLIEKVYYIDSNINQTKDFALNEIISNSHYNPKQLLSIGNRLSNEIKWSKKLGMQTCFMRYGEHKEEAPESLLEIPDFEISSLKQLFSLISVA